MSGLLQKIKINRSYLLNKIVLIFGLIIFAGAGTLMLLRSSAAPVSTVSVDFGVTHVRPTYTHFEDAMMRHRTFSGVSSPEREALNEIGVKHERVFVRLDKVQTVVDGSLSFAGNQYTFGDSWIDEMNAHAVAPWLTQEVDDWKGTNEWFIQPPLDATDLSRYEALWYKIVRRTKERAPLTEFIEMMNEPDLGKWGLSDADRANLWVRNAKVVNRVNADLGLPNAVYGTKLKAGGPSFIAASVRNEKIRAFINDIYAKDMADAEDLKPHFFSYHDLKGGIDPADINDVGFAIRSYMNNAAFGSYWANVPIWNTAYGVRSSEASDPLSSELNKQDPPANVLAQTAAGLAASHFYMMEGGVSYGSIFTTTNYLDYTQSVLLPQSNTGPAVGGRDISYYRNGRRKTPLSNLFLMMSKIEGNRTKVDLNGSLTLNAAGEGVGVIATKSSNKVYIQAWNYRDSALSGFDSDVNFTLRNLAAAGIADNEPATVRMYVINTTTSNIAYGDHTREDLTLVSTTTLLPGATRVLSRFMETNEVVLYEIIGNSTLEPTPLPTPTVTPTSTPAPTPTPSPVPTPTPILDTTRPNVSITSPANGGILNSSNISVVTTASDNVAVSTVVLYVDGSRYNSVSSPPYSFNVMGLGYGPHQIYAIATDTSGNTRQSTTISFSININPTPGDITGDGTVDLADFFTLRSNFGLYSRTRSQGDLTGDGSVDLSDFYELRRYFGL